ncbi:MAG: hypothetical protein J2P47_13665 [Acetobacteraceae bacterium]|nr:hypothetical protein [Acetobacteraceae bacterium]
MPGAIARGVGLGAFFALTVLGACAPSRDERVASDRAREITPECRTAAQNDPTVRQMMIASAGVPGRLAEDQNALAYARNQAERKCMQSKGLMRGGVEPVRSQWYSFPF